MAAVVANKVKRQRNSRSARHDGSGPLKLEIDAQGKLREVGVGENGEQLRSRARAKARANADYYKRVGRAGRQAGEGTGALRDIDPTFEFLSYP